jgi:hypothetical protein
MDEIVIEAVNGIGGGHRLRPGRGLAGAVSLRQRRNKKASSFPSSRNGISGWVGSKAELLGWLGGLRSGNAFPLFFSVLFLFLFLFSVLDFSNLNYKSVLQEFQVYDFFQNITMFLLTQYLVIEISLYAIAHIRF